jgi:hypothetical protein
MCEVTRGATRERNEVMVENIEISAAIVKADVGNLAVGDPVLAKYAAEIRRLGKRVKEDVIAIGRYLDQAQKHMKDAGHGTWLTWIEAEFGWSDQTARRFIHVYELSRDSKFNNLLNSDLPLSALYQLAAPKTPQEARVEIAERIEAGDTPSVAEVTEVIAQAKGTTSAQADAGAEDEDPSVKQRRAEHDALFGETSGTESGGAAPANSSVEPAGSESSDNNSLAARAKRIRGLLREQETLERKLAIAIAGSTEQERIAACTDANEEELLAAFDKTAPILEEYFAQASGADIYDRIPVARLDEVIAAFLDKLTVEGMRTRMSEEFGRELRARLPAPPKSGKPFKKGLNHTANSARTRRGHRSRH